MKKYSSIILVFLILSIELFGQKSISLTEAIQHAGANNPKLKSERLNLPMAQSDVWQARLHQNPIFNLQYMQLLPSSMYYDHNYSILNSINSQDWFQLTKKFQVLGQRKDRIELAKMGHSSAEINFLETKRNVLYDVSLKWVEAWRALAKKNISIKAADYLDDYMKENFDSIKGEGGMEPEELLRFSILDDQYDLERSKAELTYSSILEELKLLLGTQNAIEIDMNDTLEMVRISSSLDSVIAYASANRNDQKSLIKRKNISLKNISYQKKLAIPQPEAGLIWNPQNSIPYLGIFYTQVLPFFDRNQAVIQKAKIASEMASIDLETNKLKIDNEVTIAFANYKKSYEMAARFKHNLKDSEKLVKMVRDAYLKKEDSIVDLWEAEQTWIQSYTFYYDAFADYRSSYVTLLYQLNMLD